jgi:hypothetical protein
LLPASLASLQPLVPTERRPDHRGRRRPARWRYSPNAARSDCRCRRLCRAQRLNGRPGRRTKTRPCCRWSRSPESKSTLGTCSGYACHHVVDDDEAVIGARPTNAMLGHPRSGRGALCLPHSLMNGFPSVMVAGRTGVTFARWIRPSRTNSKRSCRAPVGAAASSTTCHAARRRPRAHDRTGPSGSADGFAAQLTRFVPFRAGTRPHAVVGDPNVETIPRL